MTFWRLLILGVVIFGVGIYLLWWLRTDSWQLPKEEKTKWDDEFRKTGSDQ